MTIEAAFSFFIAIFIFSITPGPGVFAILARAMVSGPRQCIALALGMVASDLIYLLLACFGLATVAENFTDVFLLIRYVGAAYLIYLGYKMFRSLPQVKDEIKAESQSVNKREGLASFTQGFLISASNPKVILFYISFLPTFIDLTALTTQDIFLVSLLSSIALMCGLMLIAMAAGRMTRLLQTPKAHQRLNQGAGGIMIAAGSFLGLSN